MKTFHRYIFKQVLHTALLSIGFFILVLVLGNALRDVVDKMANAQIPLSTILYLIGLIIPGVLPYALPMGLLTSILLVFGRMSAQQEITAARAAGFSLLNIATPVFLLAFLAVIFSLFINLYYAPIADTQYKRCLINIIKENPLRFIQPKTFVQDFPGYTLYLSKTDGNNVEDIWIWELNEEKKVTLFIKAQKGYFSFDASKNAIVMHITKGIAEKRNATNPEFFQSNHTPLLLFDTLSIELPLDKILNHTPHRKLAFHTFSELIHLRQSTHTPSQFSSRIKIQLEIQKKFVMAFSVFSLVFMAIPLGIKVSRSETLVNLILAIILAIIYYFLLVVFSWTERYPNCRPDLLIWFPNIIFQSIGLYLFLRSNYKNG